MARINYKEEFADSLALAKTMTLRELRQDLRDHLAYHKAHVDAVRFEIDTRPRKNKPKEQQ